MPTRAQMANAKRQREAQLATCIKCGIERSWNDFNPSPSRRPFGLASMCKPCDLERKSGQKRTRWYAQPEIEREKARCKALRKKFGITANQYDRMFEQQKGLCAICGESEVYLHHATQKIARLAVDHNHKTGKVRELLCGNCNKGIGCLQENPEILEAAIAYLRKHK